MRVSPTVLGLVLLAQAGLPAFGDWLSVRGDAKLSGQANSTIPSPLAIRWTYEAGGAVAGIAIKGNTAVAADESGMVHAINLDDGKARWQVELGTSIEAPPTIDGDRVYVGDFDGKLHAVALADGSRLWSFATEGEIHAGVTVTDACLLIGSHDATVRCLSRDGKELWKVETENFVNSAVAVADGVVWVAGCDGFLRGLDLATGRERSKVPLGGYVAASPAVTGKTAIVGTFENEVLGIDLANNTVAWRWSDPERSFPFASSPTTNGTLSWIGGRDRRVHAFEVATGTLAWSWNAGARVDASPLLAGDRLAVATDRGKLVILEAKSGRELTSIELGGALTSPAASQNLLLVGSADGLVYALGAPQ